jgi:hypothetical protein
VKFLLFLLVQIYAAIAFSQQSAVSTGGEINSAFVNISYSIGQTFFESNNIDSLTFNHGLQQPFKHDNLQTSIVKKIILEVYPNPTTQQIWINLNSYKSSMLSYSLINLHGMIIEKNSIQNEISNISTDFLPPSTYFLIVYDDFNKIASFKIIKL